MEEITPHRTAFLGKLIGLYCIAISISILAHAQATVEIMKAILRDPPLLFIAGLLGMTAGLAIVLAHNVWSGGALAIAVGDRVLMLENSVYSVITPEGCASIIWRDSNKAELAAEALKMTAADLAELKLIDEIVPEPEGGAHTDHKAAAQLLDVVLVRLLDELSAQSPQQLVDARYRKFRAMGQFFS